MDKLSEKREINIVENVEYIWPLKASYGFHKKRILRIKVSSIAIERKGI